MSVDYRLDNVNRLMSPEEELKENSSHGDSQLKVVILDNTKQLIQNNRAVDISQIADKEEVSHNQVPLPSTFKTMINLQTAHKKVMIPQ